MRKKVLITVFVIILFAVMNFIAFLSAFVPFSTPVETDWKDFLYRGLGFLVLQCLALLASSRIQSKWVYLLLFFPLGLVVCHCRGIVFLFQMSFAEVLLGDVYFYPLVACIGGLLTAIDIIIEIKLRWVEKVLARCRSEATMPFN